jgi:hypothetical protein
MHPHAANPAAQPNLSLSIFSAPAASRKEPNEGGERPSFLGVIASKDELRFARTSANRKAMGFVVQWEPSASYPVLCSGSRFGPVLRPAARRRSASATRPFGLRFPSSMDPP